MYLKFTKIYLVVDIANSKVESMFVVFMPLHMPFCVESEFKNSIKPQIGPLMFYKIKVSKLCFKTNSE
jgi:hypothetical protein